MDALEAAAQPQIDEAVARAKEAAAAANAATEEAERKLSESHVERAALEHQQTSLRDMLRHLQSQVQDLNNDMSA